MELIIVCIVLCWQQCSDIDFWVSISNFDKCRVFSTWGNIVLFHDGWSKLLKLIWFKWPIMIGFWFSGEAKWQQLPSKTTISEIKCYDHLSNITICDFATTNNIVHHFKKVFKFLPWLKCHRQSALDFQYWLSSEEL